VNGKPAGKDPEQRIGLLEEESLEVYIGEHSDAEFTHGLCPDCVNQIYPELYKKR